MEENKEIARWRRIQEKWEARPVPNWNLETKTYLMPNDSQLDPLEVAQHDMLMKRALKLLNIQHYGIMIKRVAR